MKDTVTMLTKLTVELNNLDNITESTLSFFLNSNLCTSAELNTINNIADIIIVDCDRGITDGLLENLTKHNQYAVLLYMLGNKPEDRRARTICVKKPIVVSELTHAFEKVEQHKVSNTITTRETVTERTSQTKGDYAGKVNDEMDTSIDGSTDKINTNITNPLKHTAKAVVDNITEAQLIEDMDKHEQSVSTNVIDEYQQKVERTINKAIGSTSVLNELIAENSGVDILPNAIDEQDNTQVTLVSEEEIRAAINNTISDKTDLYEDAIAVQQIVRKQLSQIKHVEPQAKLFLQNTHLEMAVKDETDQSKDNQYKAHKHVGSNKDIDPSDPEQLKTVYHSHKKYLYFVLKEAVKIANKRNSDVLMETILGKIIYEKKSNLFHYRYEESKLNYAQKSPLFSDTKFSVIKVTPEHLKLKTQNQDAQILIWNSAISASKGRVPNNTSLTASVTMSCWPNFTKLKVFRYAVQITSAWSRNNLSLIETAKQLQIPQRYVFTLYNAMRALEYANVDDKLSQDKSIKSKSKSIFSKILSHIFK